MSETSGNPARVPAKRPNILLSMENDLRTVNELLGAVDLLFQDNLESSRDLDNATASMIFRIIMITQDYHRNLMKVWEAGVVAMRAEREAQQ